MVPFTGMMRLGYAHYILGVKRFYASTLSGHDVRRRKSAARRVLAAVSARCERTSAAPTLSFAGRRQKPVKYEFAER
jgi:hypothetical protein